MSVHALQELGSRTHEAERFVLNRTLTLHIGLPKTATTFLQHWILKPTLGHGFIHRTRGDRAKRICRYFKELAAASDSEAKTCHNKIRSSLIFHCKKFPDLGGLVVSDENISGRAIEFWHSKGPGPAQLAKRLGELSQDLTDLFPTTRVIIGIRRQDQWLASRYAESSTVFDNFCQSDFDRRLLDLSQRDPLGPVFDWLDFHKVHAIFSQALGPENLLMVSMERLGTEPESTLEDMGEFLGELGLPGLYRKLVADDVGVVRNTLSAGNDTWRLRRDGSPLRLTPELQGAILTRLAESNRALNRLVSLDFG